MLRKPFESHQLIGAITLWFCPSEAKAARFGALLCLRSRNYIRSTSNAFRASQSPPPDSKSLCFRDTKPEPIHTTDLSSFILNIAGKIRIQIIFLLNKSNYSLLNLFIISRLNFIVGMPTILDFACNLT